jgi:acetoin utilization deacetylase AcuC-like enzyme
MPGQIFFGGYGFLNNAALAAQLGTGAGLGFNRNFPLPRGTGFAVWRVALAQTLQAIKAFGAQALVVSLGLDTFVGDPISG